MEFLLIAFVAGAAGFIGSRVGSAHEKRRLANVEAAVAGMFLALSQKMPDLFQKPGAQQPRELG